MLCLQVSCPALRYGASLCCPEALRTLISGLSELPLAAVSRCAGRSLFSIVLCVLLAVRVHQVFQTGDAEAKTSILVLGGGSILSPATSEMS